MTVVGINKQLAHAQAGQGRNITKITLFTPLDGENYE